MAGIRRRGTRRFVGAAAILLVIAAGLGLVAATNSGAQGGVTTGSFLFRDDGVVVFQTGSTNRFVWDKPAPQTDVTQALVVGTSGNRNCIVQETTTPIIDLAPNGATGFVGGSLGVFGGGSRGTPCGRVNSGETLTIALGSSFATSVAFTARFDLEMKSNAVVRADFYLDGGQVATRRAYSGTSTSPGGTANFQCAGGGSDSNPDSGPSDNCTWVAIPDANLGSTSPILFDEVRLSAENGEFSVEGGGDYATAGLPVQDTRFRVGAVAVDEGDLGCEPGQGNGDTATEQGVYEVRRLQNGDGTTCVVVDYNLTFGTVNGTPNLSFRKDLSDPTQQNAQFNVESPWPAVPNGQVTWLTTTFDFELNNPFVLERCPFGGYLSNGEYTILTDGRTPASLISAGYDKEPSLPGLQYACIFDRQETTIGGLTTVTESIYIIGDAIMRR